MNPDSDKPDQMDLVEEEVDEAVLEEYHAMLEVFEEVRVFTQADRQRHAWQLANAGMTADLLQDENLEVAVLEQFGLDPRPSRVLHSALTKLRLRWVSPEAGVVNCPEGQGVEFQVNVARGSGELLYRWYKHTLSPSGRLEKRLLDCDTDRLRLTAVDINDSGHYSFCVTDARGVQVQPERPLWELRVRLVRDFEELDDRERWYWWLDQMVPRPRFHLADKFNRAKLDEIGLDVLLPMFYSRERSYILFKVTADGPEKNSSTVIPCRNMDFLQDVIELRTLVARPEEIEHLLEQRRASPTLLRNYIISVLGSEPPRDADPDDADALVRHIIEHLGENSEAPRPLPPVSLVEGKKELSGAHLGARFLVGQNGIYARGYGAPKPLLPMPPKQPDLSVIRRPVPLPPGQEGLVQSLNQRIQSQAAVVPVTDNPPKLVVGDVKPAASAHQMALQSAGVSVGISLAIELLRSGYLYHRGQISGKAAAQQVALTTATGGLIAGGYTYASLALQQLAVSQAGNLAGQAAKAILRSPNFAVGAVLVAISTCVDLYRWNKGQLSGRQLRENVVANVASTAASTMAFVGTATVMGAALATSWTGIGLLVLLGLGVGLAVDKGVRSAVRFLEQRALLQQMRANAFELLGLDPSDTLDAAKREAVNGRYRVIGTYLHPDAANSRSGANATLFNLMTEARDFVLDPSTNFDLLVNFQGLGEDGAFA